MRIDDDWNHYTYRYGDPPRRAGVRFDVARALQPTPDSHDHCVRLRLAGDAVGFQETLTEVLADVDCWLVGVLAYQEGTTWVLQVEDRDGLEARREALGKAAPGALTWEQSPGWDFFEDRVCPTERDWQRISDREQLDALPAEIERHEPRAIHHAFFGDAQSLAPLRARLEPEDFIVVEQSDRRLVMAVSDPPAEISRRTVALAELARKHGALYDGWKLG